MKRLSLALAAMGLTAGAFAALPAATDPTVVNVPQLPGGFVVGVTGYYLQASNTNGDLDYASVNNTFGFTGTNFSAGLQNVDPGYDWGWGVNVGYIFPNTGNDVNLSYFQLDTSDTASVRHAPFGVSPLDFNDWGPDFDYDHVSAKAEYDLNQVDLTAGQYIDVGCRLILHPFAGLRWAQLDRKLDSGFSRVTSTVSATAVTTHTSSQYLNEESDFQGIGPIAGIDASYYVGMGFGVVGHFDSALLVGNVDVTTNAYGTITSANNVVPANSSSSANAHFSASNIRRIVPVLDAKLGLDYTYVFNNSSNSDLTLEAGWMVSNYFNAVDRIDAAGSLSSASVNGRTTSDVGLNGPYVSLVFHA